MSKPNWTKAQVEEMFEKAVGLYLTIVGLTESPREGAEIITMMHVMLYLNYGDGETTPDTMLNDYVQNFKTHYTAQSKAMKKAAN